MKVNYFNQIEADYDDIKLDMAKMQGYVPKGCLLGGIVVMNEVNKGNSPCWGCECPREKCGGKAKEFITNLNN